MFDPSLMRPVDVGGMISQGIEKGMEQGRQNKARAAMAALVRDPANQGALQALAEVDPQAAQQFQSQRMEQVKAQMAQHQDGILKGAQIIRQMNPKDDAGWQQARATAAQMGIDVSQVPEHFDPQYMQGVVALADAFAPRSGQDGFTLSPGQHRYGADGSEIASVPGQPRYYPVAPGGKLVLDPSYGGGAPQGPLTDEQMRALDGGQAATPPAMFP